MEKLIAYIGCLLFWGFIAVKAWGVTFAAWSWCGGGRFYPCCRGSVLPFSGWACEGPALSGDCRRYLHPAGGHARLLPGDVAYAAV